MDFRTVLACCALCLALPAAAVVIRADRDDAEYLELATRYTAAIPLGSSGEGTLIAPRWVLTAASVARALEVAGARLRVRIGEREHEVKSVLRSPPGPEGGIALLLLREPVDGIEPVPIYRASDEEGKGVVIVGHGATGRLGEATLARDGKARGAINTVDRAAGATLALDLKKPDDASDLQGAAGPGDEGAPAFVETKQGLFVAGISQGSRGASPKAGDSDRYARVSAFAAWIDEAMFRAAVEETADSAARPRPRR